MECFDRHPDRRSGRPYRFTRAVCRLCVVLLAGIAAVSLGTPAVAGAAGGAHAANPSRGSDCDPRVQVLPDLGGPFADALAFNAAGTYVGSAQPTGPGAPSYATYWDVFGIHIIGTPPGFDFSQALAINASGEIIVFGANTTTGAGVSWVYVDGRLHRLAGLGGGFTLARRINDSGMIAGSAIDAHGHGYAVVWSSWAAQPTRLMPALGDLASAGSGISQSGDAAGDTDGPPAGAGPPRPALWEGPHRIRVLQTLPASGFPYGYLRNVNDIGMAAGALGNTTGSVTHAAVWRGGAVDDLGVLPGDTFSDALGMASNGWVTGVSVLVDSHGNAVHGHAIFWPGHGPLEELPGLSGSPATDFSNAHGIDRNGTVSGVSMDTGGVGRATVWSCAQRLAFDPQAATTSNQDSAVRGGPSATAMRQSRERLFAASYQR